MKSINIFLSIILLTCITSCKKEKLSINKTIGNLTISKETPKPGDSLKLRYSFNNEVLDSTQKFEPFIIYYVNNLGYAEDIKLTNNNGLWEGTIKIPDSITAIVLNFKTGDTYDTNNKKGYTFPLYNTENKQIEGSNTSLGYYYLREGEFYGVDVDKNASLALIEKDIKEYPFLKEKLNIKYLGLLYRVDKEKGRLLIEEQITIYKAKEILTEKEYSNLTTLHYTLKNSKIADSINTIAINKFPNGNAAKKAIAHTFSKEKKLKKKIKIYNTFITKYNDNGYLKSDMAWALAHEFNKIKDYENLTKYANQISDKSNLARLYNDIAWNIVQKDEDLQFASEISKLSLNLIQSSKKPIYSTESNHKKRVRSSYVMFADTYAWILFKLGKTKDAIKYQEDVTKDFIIGSGDSQNMNNRYIEFLIADNQFEKAQTKAELFIKKGASNSTMYQHLKDAYIKNNGSNNGFETLITELGKESKKTKLAEIKKKILNKNAPDFKLKNLEGKDIALTDLKNKVVVLDFWATWCGPCIASFPAMQTAMKKYKNNPNIVFLFIDTRERGSQEDMKKNASNFIAKNNYTFNVLLDTKTNKDSDNFSTVSNYEVKGIPTKIIIGTDGKIKFKSVGYSGNADALIEELDIMIEVAQS